MTSLHLTYPYSYTHKRPQVACTVVLEHRGDILLGKRHGGSDAYPLFWSLPGGFLNAEAETVEECAVRELREETEYTAHPFVATLFHVSSKPGIDPRGHTVNLCYSVEHLGKVRPWTAAGDDLVELGWFPQRLVGGMDLAFDHNRILDVYGAVRGSTKR